MSSFPNALEGDEPEGPRGAELFIRDPRTERVLADNHLEYEFVVIDLADIDLSALDADTGEPERQMRDEVIHVDVAQRYAQDLSWGSQFPAGVLSRHGSQFAIADFHHRLWAARHVKLTQVSAYVVPELHDFDLIELGNLLNRNHGVPLTETERIRQALWGLELGRFKTISQAAKVLGVKESSVGKEKRIREAQARAKEVGISEIGFAMLPKFTRERLGTLTSPDVFKAATQSVMNKGLGTTDVNELVTKVNAAPGDAAKMEAVRAFASEVEPKPTPITRGADLWHQTHMHLRALLGIDFASEEFSIALSRRPLHDLQAGRDELQAARSALTTAISKLDGAIASAEVGESDVG